MMSRLKDDIGVGATAEDVEDGWLESEKESRGSSEDIEVLQGSLGKEGLREDACRGVGVVGETVAEGEWCDDGVVVDRVGDIQVEEGNWWEE